MSLWDIFMNLPLWAVVVLLLYSLVSFLQLFDDISSTIREILEREW